MGAGGVGQKRSYDESRPATGDVDVNTAGTKIGQSGGEVSSNLRTSVIAPSLANRDSSSGQAQGQINNNDSSKASLTTRFVAHCSLESNQIGDEGCKGLGEGLKHNTSLQKLE